MRGRTSTMLRSVEERDNLVEQYLPLVRYVVARLPVTMPASLDRDDFYSVGVMGLMHAAATYDPARGASFKTFAYTAVRGAILDEVRKHDPVPRNRRDRLRKMDRAIAALRSDLDREPTIEELAEHLGSSEREIDEDLQALHTSRTLSLDATAPGNAEAGTLGDAISGSEPSPGSAVDAREDRERLAKAITELPEGDRNVVILYYNEGLYLKEIGQILGVTESRVSQILTRAIERLRLKLKTEV
ncbi:MAG: FliA/WhiG family RNA polymerase sigma factor [bacterium]|nr:FliA/WhiG family RNA polymerase sigma factor [bacterium]